MKNIAENAEKELHINKTTNDEGIEKQTILEQKIQKLNEENQQLKTEVESYKKVMQLLTTEKPNVTNSWQYVSGKNASGACNKNNVSKITTTPINNFFEPLAEFQIERNDYEENNSHHQNDYKNIVFNNTNSIPQIHSVRKKPNVCTTEK